MLIPSQRRCGCWLPQGLVLLRAARIVGVTGQTSDISCSCDSNKNRTSAHWKWTSHGMLQQSCGELSTRHLSRLTTLNSSSDICGILLLSGGSGMPRLAAQFPLALPNIALGPRCTWVSLEGCGYNVGLNWRVERQIYPPGETPANDNVFPIRFGRDHVTPGWTAWRMEWK